MHVFTTPSDPHSHGAWDKNRNPYPLGNCINPNTATARAPGTCGFVVPGSCLIGNYRISQPVWLLALIYNSRWQSLFLQQFQKGLEDGNSDEATQDGYVTPTLDEGPWSVTDVSTLRWDQIDQLTDLWFLLADEMSLDFPDVTTVSLIGCRHLTDAALTNFGSIFPNVQQVCVCCIKRNVEIRKKHATPRKF